MSAKSFFREHSWGKSVGRGGRKGDRKEGKKHSTSLQVSTHQKLSTSLGAPLKRSTQHSCQENWIFMPHTEHDQEGGEPLGQAALLGSGSPKEDAIWGQGSEQSWINRNNGGRSKIVENVLLYGDHSCLEQFKLSLGDFRNRLEFEGSPAHMEATIPFLPENNWLT